MKKNSKHLEILVSKHQIRRKEKNFFAGKTFHGLKTEIIRENKVLKRY